MAEAAVVTGTGEELEGVVGFEGHRGSRMIPRFLAQGNNASSQGHKGCATEASIQPRVGSSAETGTST